MGDSAERYADEIILTSDNPRSEAPMDIIRDILCGIKSKPVYIDIERARAVEHTLLTAKADEVIAITARHAMDLVLRCPTHAAKIETLPMDIADPYGGDKDVYHDCLQLLSCAIGLRWFAGDGQI